MPHDLHDEFFASNLEIRIVERVLTLLFYLIQNFFKSSLISVWDWATLTFSLATIITNSPSARDVLKNQAVGFLVDMELLVITNRFGLNNTRKRHIETILLTHFHKIFFGENFASRPASRLKRKID